MKKILLFTAAIFITVIFFNGCAEEKKESTKGDKLFDDSRIHTIHLFFNQKNYWDSLMIYKALRDTDEVTKYLMCNVIIDSTAVYAIGLRFKGESSFDTKSKKKSFKLSLNQFNQKQDYDKIKNLNLNNNFKDPTMMREKLILDFMRQQGLPAPRCAYAKVYVDNVYYGLYLMVEEIDKTFLNENFGNDTGNLYIGEPAAYLIYISEKKNDYIRKYRKKSNFEEDDWADLIGLIFAMNGYGKSENYSENLDKVFNVESCLKTWAINNLFVNPDAYNMLYRHNFYLYHNSETGKFEWISYDYNFGFAAWNPRYKLEQIQNFDILYVDEPQKEHAFAMNLLKNNDNYKNRYLEIMTELVEKDFASGKLEPKIDSTANLIRKEVYADTMKFSSNEDFEKNLFEDLGDVSDPGAFVPGLKPFIIKRRESVLKQLEVLKKK